MVCSRFNSGVRLALVSLLLLVGRSMAHSAPLTATLTILNDSTTPKTTSFVYSCKGHGH